MDVAPWMIANLGPTVRGWVSRAKSPLDEFDTTMALWVIKPGRQGEHEDYFLERDLACLTFRDVPSVCEINSSEKMRFLFLAVRPNAPKRAAANYAAQTWAFRGLCRMGDMIVLPLKSSSNIVVGQVASDYRYNNAADEPYRHERDVAWGSSLIDRRKIDADLRYSFSANKTFSGTKRQDAETRVRRLLDAELAGHNHKPQQAPLAAGEIILDPTEQIAWQKLKRHVEERFNGHDLSRLFAELLKLDGFHISVSPEGPDGGCDILAARGDFGFEGPRICVQVKRTSKPVGVPVFRELLGTMQMQRATHGILVSWSGFTQATEREAQGKFFDVRLIDGDELMRMVLERHEALPSEFRRRLPIRRGWVLRPDAPSSS